MPDFPFIPQVAGVPPLFRAAGVSFVASISGTTMSVSNVITGSLAVGQNITTTGVELGTQITQFLGGIGGVGTYTVSVAQNVASQAMQVLSNIGIPLPGELSSDGASVSQASGNTPQWGIFDNDGNAVIVPDSVVKIPSFSHDFRVSDFPVEQGTFSSYNKVAVPFEGRFLFNKGGSQQDRSAFLDSLETIVADTKLYNFSTPEKNYPSVNLMHYDYARAADAGFQLIGAELHLVQIRIAASPAFSNTQDPAAASATNNGAVQPQTPTAAQTAQAQKATEASYGVGATLHPGPPAP